MAEKTMNKKEYILTLLNALLDTWPLAKGLKILVESGNLDDKTIDALVDIFKEVIKTVSDKSKKAKLQKGLDFLQKVKEAEMKAKEEDHKDLANLDKMLEGI